MALTDSYEKIFKNKQRILIVFSHPDDAEIYAGATICRLTSDGKEVRVVKMTLGNKGSRDQVVSEQALSSTRLQEDKDAMGIMGITPNNNIYLNFGDGEIENSLKEIGALAEQIRIFKPDLIITHNPEDVIVRFDAETNWINHRDHRNTGKSAIDAAYPYSRDILFFPEQFKNPKATSHSTTEFLLIDYYDHADTISIDVTDHIDSRNKAISSHISQYTPEKAQWSTDFFTKLDNSGKRYERFRYVIAD